MDRQQIIYVHDSRIVCEITKESIAQMLQIPYHFVYETLSDDDLNSKYDPKRIYRRLRTTQNSQRQLRMLRMASTDREMEKIQISQNLLKMTLS